MNLENINHYLYILVIICCIIILITIFKSLFYDKLNKNNDNLKDKSIGFLLKMIIITSIILLISIILNLTLKYKDNKLLEYYFVFSTQIINDEKNLLTYPQKSILNLDENFDKENKYDYDIKQNILINYDNLTNNYSFLNVNKVNSIFLYEMSNLIYNLYTNVYSDILNKYNLYSINYINSYGFEINNDKYIVCRYLDMKWCIFKYENVNNIHQYKPVSYLYKSYIYNYYRLIDIENDEILCKLDTIGPDHINDININKYYSIYGKYSLNENNLTLKKNKKMMIKNYLSMLLPFTFTTTLKNTNYNNNFK